MKIIHCGDIHLDSKMEANLSPRQAKQRKSELILSFCNLAKYAKENGVRVVIIAGDLFDTNKVIPSTRDVFLNAVRGCSNTDFLYLRGNHDNEVTFDNAEIPENLKLFGDEWTTFDYGEVVITGAELTKDNCRSIYGSLVLDRERFNIVTMHGQISTASGMDLVNQTELVDRGIDYLALGHIHLRENGKLDSRGVWCNCGCLEGRGFDECGDKGFIEIEVENNTANAKFVKMSHRDIVVRKCDVSGLTDSGKILQKIEQDTADISENAMVKLMLTGNLAAGVKKDTELFTQSLKNRFWFIKIVDETGLEINPEDYMNDISLKGEFVRLAVGSGLPKETIDRVIECGLNALSGEVM